MWRVGIKGFLFAILGRWVSKKLGNLVGVKPGSEMLTAMKLAKKHKNLHVVYALSDKLEEGEVWEGDTGFIHLSVDKYLEAGVRRQAFLCGPPLMIEAVTSVLEEKGTKDIFYDEF